MSKAVRSLARFDLGFPGVVLAALALIGALFALTWQKLGFNTDSVSYDPHHDPALADMYSIYETAGGYEQVAISFDAPKGRAG
jgi:hypothetical protein